MKNHLLIINETSCMYAFSMSYRHSAKRKTPFSLKDRPILESSNLFMFLQTAAHIFPESVVAFNSRMTRAEEDDEVNKFQGRTDSKF